VNCNLSVDCNQLANGNYRKPGWTLAGLISRVIEGLSKVFSPGEKFVDNTQELYLYNVLTIAL